MHSERMAAVEFFASMNLPFVSRLRNPGSLSTMRTSKRFSGIPGLRDAG